MIRDMKPEEDDELTAFVRKIELALTPGFAEVLSEETRKVQRALLVLSFLYGLVVFGAIEFSGNVEFVGLKFAGPSAKDAVVFLGFVVCSYLEVLVAIRCYSEWHLWRLRARKVDLDVKNIEANIQSLRLAISSDLEAPPHVDDTNGIELTIDSSATRFLMPMSFIRLLPLRQRISAFFLGHRVRSKQHTIRVTDATAANIERVKKFGQQYMWFYQDSEAYSNSRRVRVWFEILFPLLFGGSIVIYALFSFMGLG